MYVQSLHKNLLTHSANSLSLCGGFLAATTGGLEFYIVELTIDMQHFVNLSKIDLFSKIISIKVE